MLSENKSLDTGLHPGCKFMERSGCVLHAYNIIYISINNKLYLSQIELDRKDQGSRVRSNVLQQFSCSLSTILNVVRSVERGAVSRGGEDTSKG